MVGKTDQKPRAADVDPNKKRKRDASDKQRNSDIKRNRKDEKQSTPKSDKRTSDANELKGNALNVLSELQNGDTANTTTKTKDQSELQSAGESNGWKISSPLGGRIADIDPVFSSDAKHLILTYHTSLQVYSVADSLLVRRIPLPIAKDNKDSPTASVLTTHLSPVEPDFVWVGCSDGRIWKFNWRQGIKPEDTLMTKSQTALDFCVTAIKVNEDLHDVVFVSEKKQNDEGTIVAYCRMGASHLASQVLFKTVRPDQAIHVLRATADGRYVVGAHSEGLVVGTITGQDLELEGDFFNFDTSDIVCTLDLRVTSRQQGLSTPKKQTVKPSSEVLDVIIGCGRGAMFLYNDILTKLQSMRGPKPKQKGVQARKFHWHRRAVRSVKWSKDGHYLVSGGSENTLVLWQVDTAITTYLPHLPGAIENIVVSPSGAQYAIHLDDNSSMVISTSEMKPVTLRIPW
ncbi:U3 small nucleolar RNA-associated protein 17 like [Verticillium longisporum]|nr:U3 small nucleolar RNA-associated protein 17 like [Verticillium longisporum]